MSKTYVYATIADSTKAAEFLEEVIEISKRYGLSISHEDGQGGFQIEKYHDTYSNWLREAEVRVEPLPGSIEAYQ